MEETGYLHPLYAGSLREFGEPLELPSSQGWVLRRSIPATAYFDSMGCYPMFMCRDWSKLGKDLQQIREHMISISLVTDSFGKYTQQELEFHFKDIARPYKQHFIIDLQRSPVHYIAAHHQRNARKALKNVTVEICPEPLQFLNEWCMLYDNLIERHHIKGITRFSREVFTTQLTIPGLVVFRASVNGETVGMLLWYLQNEVGYYHLGAYNSIGYEQNASFALFWRLIEYFADSGLKWLNLGAGAGSYNDGQDGLSRFKRGWATSTRTAYFCGRIFDRQKYQQIIEQKNIPSTDFFPAYRLGEF